MQSNNKKELQERKEFMTHDIAPTLMPTLRGLFQVRVLGLYRSHAELQINLVNSSREILQSFGKQIVPKGGAIVIDNFSSVLDLPGTTTPTEAFFQAWIIGMNTENTEAEISLRLVDEDRKELINFGSTVRGIGGTIVLEGMDIAVNIIKRG